MTRSSFFIGLSILLMISSCVKDTKIEPEPIIETPPTVNFRFDTKINGKPLVPVTGTYTNVAEDSITVTKFNYYITNIKLIDDKGFAFSEPESYHLVQHVEGKTSFDLHDVPVGNYTRIEFMIGVDSLRNVSGAQTGALDPANDMFWDWNQGYVFFKLEGGFNTVSVPQWQEYSIHIGGFKGQYKCQQDCFFNLSTPIVAGKNKKSTVSFSTSVDEIFTKPSVIGMDDYYNYYINDQGFKAVSENYKDMFVIDKIEN